MPMFQVFNDHKKICNPWLFRAVAHVQEAILLQSHQPEIYGQHQVLILFNTNMACHQIVHINPCSEFNF